MSKPDAPEPPDPSEISGTQFSYNKDAALFGAGLNRIDQSTPYGSLSYKTDFNEDAYKQAFDEWYQASIPLRIGGRGLESLKTIMKGMGKPMPEKEDFTYRSVETQLAPEMQKMLDLRNQAGVSFGETALNQLGNVQNRLSEPVDFSQFGELPTVNENTRTQTRDAILGRMQPLFDRDLDRLETRLANQGIGLGSEAYDDALQTYQRGVTDARLAADAQAGNEMSRDFGLETAARNQAVQEMLTGRTQPLNELAALMSGAQLQNPNFVNVPQANIQPPNFQQAAYNSYQGELSNYANDLNSYNAMAGGLFDLATAGMFGMMFSPAGAGAGAKAAGPGGGMGAIGGQSYGFLSDRRLKKNIRLIGSLPNGLNVYKFHYKWGGPEEVGVMADEVKEIMPHAVREWNGYDFVDYAEVLR